MNYASRFNEQLVINKLLTDTNDRLLESLDNKSNQYEDIIKIIEEKDRMISDKENTEVLQSRIKFVLDMAKVNNVDTLILGAYGCGVFGQNPTEVAEIFKECLNTSHKNCFSKVIFAIPKGRDNNLQAFEKAFRE